MEPQEKREFARPVDRVVNKDNVDGWLKSKAHRMLIAFLTKCNAAIKGKQVSDAPKQVSASVEGLLRLVDAVEKIVDECPPIEQPQRFGNKGFRPFAERLEKEAQELIAQALPEGVRGASVELAPYLCGSFGNATRLDYGTGHEMSFVIMLVCLDALRLFEDGDYVALPLRVFDKYICLCRKIQRRYMLEPAGSHGVWSLDDYQFLCFLWGSAQLVGQSEIPPGAILQQDLVRREKNEYLYCAAIDYIFLTKKGPFFEHSPVLHNISGVVSWEKINGGMFKMFEAEVLSKAPIIQHVYFGTLFPAP